MAGVQITVRPVVVCPYSFAKNVETVEEMMSMTADWRHGGAFVRPTWSVFWILA